MWKIIAIVGVVILLTIAFWKRDHSSPWSGPVNPNQGKTSIEKYNRLGAEKSPYLLQHKDNPVHWFSWGDEAFQAAREENKIIFLSIGYSTCYWCHMMEQDSFERGDVAEVLNKDFISIKVDREEHPDIDQIYMDAVVGMTGRGGWPLSVFLTPDLKPFFGGTFFWRPQFLLLLSQIQDSWQKNPEKILESGAKITEFLEKQSKSSGTAKADISLKQLLSITVDIASSYPAGYSMLMAAIDYDLDRSKEVAVVGRPDDPTMLEIRKFFFESFIPNKVLAMGEPIALGDAMVPLILQGKPMLDNRPTIYVCENNLCKRPTTSLEEAKNFVNNFEKF